MGFGLYARCAEQVQYANRQWYDFEKVAERYKSITPIRGKLRGHLDIRPHGERARTWERIVKVSDTEYFITCEGYSGWDKNTSNIKRSYEPNRSITFKLEGDTEYITIHTPRIFWGDNIEKPFLERTPRGSYAFTAPSTYYFYEYNLPVGLGFEKFGSKPYVKVLDYDTQKHKYYVINKADVTVARKVGSKQFTPVVVHQETIRKIDRQASKAIRAKAKAFIDYVVAIAPLVEETYLYGNIIAKSCHSSNMEYEDFLQSNSEDAPEAWFGLTQGYKHKAKKSLYSSDERKWITTYGTDKDYQRVIYNDLYKLTKPFEEVEVELGKPFKNNKYYSW